MARLKSVLVALRFSINGSQQWGMLFVILLIYFFSARLGLFLSLDNSNVSPVWPATGIAISALIVFGIKYWPSILLGAFTANIASFYSNDPELPINLWLASSSIAIGNTVEALIAATLIRRFIKVKNFSSNLKNIFIFIGTILFACSISAFIGTGSLLFSEVIPSLFNDSLLLTWWLGDTTGGLLVVPFILAIKQYWNERESEPQKKLIHSNWKNILSFVLLIIIIAAIFFNSLEHYNYLRLALFLIFPLLAWIASLSGIVGVVVAILMVALFALIGTIKQYGPFATGDLNDSLILLDTFLILCACTGLLFATDLIERAHDVKQRVLLSKIALSWAVLFSSLIITLLVWHLVTENTANQGQARFQLQAQQLKEEIKERINAYALILRGAAGMMVGNPNITREQWRQYVEQLQLSKSYQGVQAVGYAMYFHADERELVENKVRQEGFENFSIFPIGNRDEYATTIYIEPFDSRNKKDFGYDMFSESARRIAMIKARDTRTITLSGRVILKQEDTSDVQYGFLMYFPLYRNHMFLNTKEERAKELQGFIYIPFRVNNLMKVIIGDRWQDIHLEIYDGDQLDYTNKLYGLSHASLENRYLYRNISPIVVGQHAWTLKMLSTDVFEKSIDRQRAQITFLAGILLSFILFALVRTLSFTRARAEQIADEMTEGLRRAQKDLQQNEERYRTLYNATPSMMYSMDAAGRIVNVSQYWLESIGYSREQVLMRQAADFFSDESRRHFENKILPELYRVGHCEDIICQMIKFNGEMIYVSFSAIGIRDHEDSISLVLAVSQDITEKLSANTALIISENRFRGAFETAAHGIALVSLEGKWLKANPALCNIVGYTQQDLLKIDFQAITHPDDLRNDLLLVNDLLNGSINSYQLEKRYFHKTGKIVWVHLSVALVRDASNAPLYFVSQIMDITVRKKIEVALLNSEERYRLMMESIKDYAVFMLDANGNVVTWNEGAAKLKGYSQEEIIGKSFSIFYEPKDVEDGLPGKILEMACHGSREFKGWRVRKDRSRFYAEIMISPIYNNQQILTGFVKVVRDVTQRHMAERALMEIQSFQAAILNNAGVAIIAADINGIVMIFNPAAEKMLSYSANEMIGRQALQQIHVQEELDRHAKKLNVELGTTIKSGFDTFVARARLGIIDTNEWTYVRKNGTKFPVQLTITTLKNADGEIKGFLGIATDITDRNKLVQQQRAMLQEKETLLREVYHRVKNNLQIIGSLFNMQLRALPEGIARDAIRDSADRVRAMSLVHEKLYQSSSLSSIDLDGYINDLCNNISISTGVFDRGIVMENNIQPIQLGLETAIPLGLILNELIHNSLKHAFPVAQNGSIKIKISDLGEGRACLEFSDNGIGLASDSQIKPKSLGLKLVNILTKQLDGVLLMENRNGFYCKLEFKLAPVTSNRTDV